MRKTMIAVIAIAAAATPAAANHIFNTNVPFPTRGACEAEVASLSVDDRDSLLARFPDLFDSRGDVAAFLTRAFPCERDPGDGNWYIEDRRLEILASEWFMGR